MALVINSNAKGVTDGSMSNMLEKINCHTPIVIVSRTEDFVFNDKLLGLDKYVLCTASEFGWDFDWSRGTPIFGKNFQSFTDLYKGDEYAKFNQFVTDRKPVLHFQRELLKKDLSDGILPIEYCAWYSSAVQSEEEFNKRPLEVFFNWGLSNPIRPNLHGDIWKRSHDLGYTVCDNLYNVNGFIANENNPRKWVTINTPHYARFPVENILDVNGFSKLSVCLPGAGRKCFRHAESPMNSVMFLKEDHMAWSFEWEDGINCIKFHNEQHIISVIDWATKTKNLYEIYKNGLATCEKYMINNYTKYLADIINAL